MIPPLPVIGILAVLSLIVTAVHAKVYGYGVVGVIASFAFLLVAYTVGLSAVVYFFGSE